MDVALPSLVMSGNAETVAQEAFDALTKTKPKKSQNSEKPDTPEKEKAKTITLSLVRDFLPDEKAEKLEKESTKAEKKQERQQKAERLQRLEEGEETGTDVASLEFSTSLLRHILK